MIIVSIFCFRIVLLRKYIHVNESSIGSVGCSDQEVECSFAATGYHSARDYSFTNRTNFTVLYISPLFYFLAACPLIESVNAGIIPECLSAEKHRTVNSLCTLPYEP